MAMPMHTKATKTSHAQIDHKNPEEPEALKPELPSDPTESPVLRKPEFKDARESSLVPEEEAEESSVFGMTSTVTVDPRL